MICHESRELLHAYADDELDVVTARQLERHLDDCAPCASAFKAARAVKAAASDPALYYRAPAGLRDAILREARSGGDAPAPRMRIFHWVPAGIAAALVTGFAIWLALHQPAASFAAADEQEVLAAHFRALQPVHALVDVESTDQHTVKPWFDTHIDYSPPVRQLASAGFPLEGGRLDYVHNRPVAALVYRRGKHVINLFVWPGESGSGTTAGVTSERGINVQHWSNGGMTFWAVSDVSAADLQTFKELLLAPTGPR